MEQRQAQSQESAPARGRCPLPLSSSSSGSSGLSFNSGESTSPGRGWSYTGMESMSNPPSAAAQTLSQRRALHSVCGDCGARQLTLQHLRERCRRNGCRSLAEAGEWIAQRCIRKCNEASSLSARALRSTALVLARIRASTESYTPGSGKLFVRAGQFRKSTAL
eukprot:3401182-Rhodomonas_salina.3